MLNCQRTKNNMFHNLPNCWKLSCACCILLNMYWHMWSVSLKHFRRRQTTSDEHNCTNKWKKDPSIILTMLFLNLCFVKLRSFISELPSRSFGFRTSVSDFPFQTFHFTTVVSKIMSLNLHVGAFVWEPWFQKLRFKPFVSELPFQNCGLWTLESEHLFQTVGFWSLISELVFHNFRFWRCFS